MMLMLAVLVMGLSSRLGFSSAGGGKRATGYAALCRMLRATHCAAVFVAYLYA